MTTTLALVLSAVFAVLAPIGYIISIIRGRSRPHRITRFILFFVLTLNFASILAAGGSPGAKLFAGIVFAQGTAIFAISLWRGMGGSSIFDWSCFAIALIGVIGWKLTGSPLVGVLFSVLADLAAYLPAFVKTWKHPHTESPWFYITSAIAAFLSLIGYALGPSSIFQIYIILCCFVMLVCIYHKKLPGRGRKTAN